MPVVKFTYSIKYNFKKIIHPRPLRHTLFPGSFLFEISIGRSGAKVHLHTHTLTYNNQKLLAKVNGSNFSKFSN